MRQLLDGTVRLSMQEATWLYRKMFPHDISSFTSEQRREIADHIEGYLNEKDLRPFEAYYYGPGDDMAQALGRLERGFRKMTGGWSLRSAKGPMLSLGESEAGQVYISAMRAHRLRKGLTCNQLADRVGCAPSTISSLELGKSSLTSGMRAAIARALGVSVLDLQGFVKIELNADVQSHAPTRRK